MRLFISVQFNDDIVNALTSAQDDLRANNVKGYYSVRQNLHLTLAFIGEFGNAELVLDAMEQVDFEPFTFALGGYIGNFGDLLWAGTEHSNHLDRLARKLRRALADNNIPFDKKKFKPHVTLLRNARYCPNSDFCISDVTIEKASMTVSHITLMRSDRGKQGMIYTELGRIAAKSTDTEEN